MTNNIRFALSIFCLGLFWLFAIATSQDTDSCILNSKIEEFGDGIKITNQDEFEYINLAVELQITVIDSSTAPNFIIDTFLIYTTEIPSLEINQNVEIPYTDFKNTIDDSSPNVDSTTYNIVLLSNSPAGELCETSEIFE